MTAPIRDHGSLPGRQIVEQLFGVLIAKHGVALQAFAHHVAEGARNRPVVNRNLNRSFLGAFDQASNDALGRVRGNTRQQFVQDQSQSKKIGALIQIFR